MDSRNYRAKLSGGQKKLLSAVETGTLAQVENIVSKTQLLNKDKSFDRILLVTALQTEHPFKILKLLLEHGVDPSKADKNGLTPLHMIYRHAASTIFIDESKGEKKDALRLKIIKLLLKHGADPFAMDSESRTPLHYTFCKFAIVRPLDEFEKLLLSANQQGINYTDDHGVSYLHMACMEGDLGLVETLVANGAPINASILPTSGQYCGYTPLHFAAGSNCLELVKFLLARGADVNAVDDADNTPLHFACDHENTAQLYGSHKKYEKNGDDVDWLSTRRNHLGIVQLLIDHGADVDAQNHSDMTPLLYNFEMPSILESNSFWYHNTEWVESLQDELSYRQQKIMDILLHHGANINVSSDYCGSILHLLPMQYNKYIASRELAEIVLEKGADVEVVEEGAGYTPLFVALAESIRREDSTEMIDVFLDHGANVNARDKNLNTPLLMILSDYDYYSKASEDVYNSLFNHPDIDVNAQNDHKKTPLHIAIDKHNIFCIEKLLESGADINLEDKYGHPPTHYILTYLDGSSDRLRRDENNTKILTAVIGHVKKLMKLKVYVSDVVINHYDVLSQHPSLKSISDSIDIEIDKEVQRLQTRKFNCYTSLYDILSKDANTMARYATNENLRAAVLPEKIRQDYKYFGCMIKRQYEKGIKTAQKALDFITNQNWPNDCSLTILSNLCEVDLDKLMLSMPEGGVHGISSQNLEKRQ